MPKSPVHDVYFIKHNHGFFVANSSNKFVIFTITVFLLRIHPISLLSSPLAAFATVAPCAFVLIVCLIATSTAIYTLT